MLVNELLLAMNNLEFYLFHGESYRERIKMVLSL